MQTLEILAVAYSPSGSTTAAAGTITSSSSVSYTPFTPNQLVLGNSAYSGNNLNGDVKRFTYYQQPLSNSNLQSFTSASNSFRTYTPTVNLTLANQSVIEAQGTVYITAALNEPATTTLSVPYTVSTLAAACTTSQVACTATFGTNYSGLASGNFTFAAGQSRSTISFTLLDDGTAGNPTINVALGAGTGFNLGTTIPTQVITIQRPSLDLNWAAMYSPATQITQAPYSSISFTRSSTATYMDATGLINYAAANVPRIDYNPTTHQPNGLLMEGPRTNSVTHSQLFSSWSNSRLTPTTSTSDTLSPAGDSTATRMTESNDGSTAQSHSAFSNTFTITAGSSWTYSMYVKVPANNADSEIKMSMVAGSDGLAAYFDLIGGNSSVLNIGTGSGATATFQNLGTGWIRCILTGIPSTTATTMSVAFNTLVAWGVGNSTYIGNGVSGIDVWGAQVEGWNFPYKLYPDHNCGGHAFS